jgi:integrase
VVNFVKYANKKGWTDVIPPIVPSHCHSTYIPHAFSNDEIKSLFEGIDAHVIKANSHHKTMCKCLNSLELPVYVRLLYSTGMRTNEARWLMRSDVNLNDGIIEINRSKGLDQHRVALHHSMTALLQRYDDRMAAMMPNRKHFFPDSKDNAHPPHWADYHFRQVWHEISDEPARIYDLRSHYAVRNVTRWKGLGYEIHQKLLYLSRSMGHRELSSTYGYFNLTPNLADKIRSCCEDSFNSLLPNLPDYGQAEER